MQISVLSLFQRYFIIFRDTINRLKSIFKNKSLSPSLILMFKNETTIILACKGKPSQLPIRQNGVKGIYTWIYLQDIIPMYLV